MANQNDSFIDEVTDDLRRDRLFNAMRKYGWIVVALILAIVGGTAWMEYSSIQSKAKAEAFGDAVLAAQETNDPAAALKAIDPAGSTGRVAVTGLLAAAEMDAAGKGADAATELRALADQIGTSDPLLRDLARLKAVIAGGEALGAADRDALLNELSQPGAPFELLALEQKAIALADADRGEDAITLIRQIQQKDGLSEGLRRRLGEMMITLGATPEAAPVVAGDETAPVEPVN